jgi:hypothetical protein
LMSENAALSKASECASLTAVNDRLPQTLESLLTVRDAV